MGAADNQCISLCTTLTPFVDFLLGRITKGPSGFCTVLWKYMRCDQDAPNIDFTNVCPWLGIELKVCVLRLLKRKHLEGEHVFTVMLKNRLSNFRSQR